MGCVHGTHQFSEEGYQPILSSLSWILIKFQKHQKDFGMVKLIEGHRIHQLGSLANSAGNGLNWLLAKYLAGRFYALQCMSSGKIYFEPLKHTIFPVWRSSCTICHFLLQFLSTNCASRFLGHFNRNSLFCYKRIKNLIIYPSLNTRLRRFRS